MNVIINSVVSLSIMGFLFAAGLAIASKKFAVEVDPKEEAILDALPGANCGGCGFPGCGGLASAIVAGKASVNACPVGGNETAQKIAEIMGVTASEGVRLVANVACNGTNENAVQKAKYLGIIDCKAAVIAQSGAKGCTYGCLGFGTCVRACKFDAIFIGTDGVAHVDREKCVACGKCIEVCPKSIIDWIPEKQQVYIFCRSREKGKEVKDLCQVGCIGCQLCVKSCPFDAMSFENNLPSIDYSKCKQCNICVQKCPTKAIKGREIKKKVQPQTTPANKDAENKQTENKPSEKAVESKPIENKTVENKVENQEVKDTKTENKTVDTNTNETKPIENQEKEIKEKEPKAENQDKNVETAKEDIKEEKVEITSTNKEETKETV